MISDWLEKMNKGEKLSPTEMQMLKEKMDDLENKVSFWSQNGPDTLYARKIWAQDAFFQNMPTSFMVMDRQADLTIPNSTFTTVTNYMTYTPVTGDRVTPSNDFFEFDTTNGRIYIKQTGRVYGFYVFVVWATNANGHRAARIYQYKKDGTEITYSVAHRMPPPPDGNLSFPSFLTIPWGGARGVGDYLTLKLYQTSGGDLAATSMAFGAFVLR